MFQVVGGCSSTNRILTIDLIPLNPYFQGTTSRRGAPFCFGSGLPYSPIARIASGWVASSMRSPSTYGQSSTLLRCPDICFGSNKVVNATYLAREVGSTFFTNEARGNPNQGITIDQASTQRIR